MSPKAKLFLGALCVALPLDVISKQWVARALPYGAQVDVIDGFFALTHVRNPGAAFGLFAGSPELVRVGFFIGVTLIAIGLIISFYRKLAPGDRFAALSLGLILGGAIGNLIDRVLYQEVIDFLHFVLPGGYEWPDFNLADSFIVVGVLLLVLELFATEGETRDTAPIADGEA
jgi:signal peptidase II